MVEQVVFVGGQLTRDVSSGAFPNDSDDDDRSPYTAWHLSNLHTAWMKLSAFLREQTTGEADYADPTIAGGSGASRAPPSTQGGDGHDRFR